MGDLCPQIYPLYMDMLGVILHTSVQCYLILLHIRLKNLHGIVIEIIFQPVIDLLIFHLILVDGLLTLHYEQVVFWVAYCDHG